MSALQRPGPPKSRKIGSGTKKDLTLPSQESSSFKMDVQISYTSGPASGLGGDLAFLELAQACAVGGGTPRSMQIDYVASADIDPLSKLGYRPTLSDKVYLNCAALIRSIQLDKLLEQIGVRKDSISIGADTTSSKAEGTNTTTATRQPPQQLQPSQQRTPPRAAG